MNSIFAPSSLADCCRIRVVVADDSAAIRKSLCDFLGTLAYVRIIGVAEDGFLADAMCSEMQPDLALIDFSMPRLNGLEVARAIRRKSPGCRVVIVSEYAPILAASCHWPEVDATIDKMELARELPGVIERLFPAP